MVLAEVACVAAAFSWAIAVTLFRRPILDYGARAINLAKCSLAAVFLGVSGLAMGQLGALTEASANAILLLAASGIVGMSFGDTALFTAVRRLGVYRTLMLQTLAPLFSAALAITFLGERLGGREFAGAGLILAGVTLVLTQKVSGGESTLFNWAGAGFATLAALGQGTGIVLAKAGMAEVPILPASFLRLASAALGLVLVVALAGRLPSAAKLLVSPKVLRRILGPTFLGTYIAILLMMSGIAFAPASIAAVLLSTTPIFSLFIDARLQRQRIRLPSLLGTLLAVAGVGVLATSG